MKHFMWPRNGISRDGGEPHSPKPTMSKSKPPRKIRSAKENAPPPDQNSSTPDHRSATKMKSQLPPRPPPSNPLKRKLCAEVAAENAISGNSDSGVKEQMFQLVGAPLVENCLSGFNSSVFAYGQTGSGKTYTMWGPANGLLKEHLSGEQRGLTPRVFERLFTRIKEEQVKHAERQLNYQCRCSLLEIYNEQITDLLDPSQKNLLIREDVKTGVYVENLTEEYVNNLTDVSQLLIKGLGNRRTGATSVNAESSRSHCVFTCVVESRCKNVADGLSSFKTSRINLVDLAGSERQKLTGAAGERLKEAGNINRSLSQLGNLINILAEISQTGKPRHIPYRDSRLTFLLQESLGGNAKLAMVCAISPSQSCKSETISTLRFAQRAKAIQNKAVVNEVMQDDVNVLRGVISQLKDELQRMKDNVNNPSNPNLAYSTAWNARRSLNLIRSFGLCHPRSLPHEDDDGDIEMEIDEAAVERLCVQVGLQSSLASEGINHDMNMINSSLQTLNDNKSCPKSSDGQSTEKQPPKDTYVAMEDASCQPENIEPETVDNARTDTETGITANQIKTPLQTLDHDSNSQPLLLKDTICSSPNETEDVPSCPGLLLEDVASANVSVADGLNEPEHLVNSASPSLCIDPVGAAPVLKSPTHSVSPTIRNSRKSLKTSEMSTASQKKDTEGDKLVIETADPSPAPSKKMNNCSTDLSTQKSKAFPVRTERLAASLHKGIKLLESYCQSTAQRRSTFRFSFKAPDSKPSAFISKADAGVQTFPEADAISDENTKEVICSKCKSREEVDAQQMGDMPNLQLVPVDNSEVTEKPKSQVPKAVERVLAGSIRREMAFEECCTKQTFEITQLNRLVQQYKHERECNAIIGQTREDKIIRLGSLMDGVLTKEDFLDEEFASLLHEHKLLKDMYQNHPEVLQTRIELERAQEEVESFRNFYGDMGEREVLLEEIQDLKMQLQCYIDPSLTSARKTCSLLKLSHQAPSSVNESLEKTLEQERLRWTEAETKWISLAEELRTELEASKAVMNKQKHELDIEKRCGEELKEAMQMAMQGHAKMLEQYADLEEKHMQLLARHRRIQEGIDDVKKAAAKAGVKGAESRFINALAAEISALKVEREKERQYLRDENKSLQTQLRDTAEAVQAAGELLVRLKEAEEGLTVAQKRAMDAEYEAAEAYKKIDKMKRRHENEINTLNQINSVSKECSTECDEAVKPSEKQWRDEFEPLYNDETEFSKLAELSCFSGYDRCNI
ncbi:unnamed protein product [Thlaspi arvense]|uniref:Kinesin motor domain-containing protein n=1 Tax=Thlaspi arvense TaxID=13288 RepID=A0AAU9T9A5_THLAR|nr:unnamed protein product [Thlaspi arvense]